MSTKKFFYVLVDKMLKPRMASNQATLFKYLEKYPECDVKSFFTKDEATNYYNAFKNNPLLANQSAEDDLLPDVDQFRKFNSSLKPNFDFEQPEKHSAPTQAPAKEPESLEDAEESFPAPSVIAKDRIQQQQSEENLEEQETSGGSLENGEKKFEWNAYYFFKEDEKALERGRKKVNPADTYYLFFDGGSSNNPGPSGAGYAIFDKDSQKIFSNSLYVGLNTNSVAEYSALIFGLKSAQNLGIKQLKTYGDSQVVVYQMTKKYQIKTQHLWKFYYEALNLMKGFESCTIEYIPREQNTEADALSKKGIDQYKGTKGK